MENVHIYIVYLSDYFSTIEKFIGVFLKLDDAVDSAVKEASVLIKQKRAKRQIKDDILEQIEDRKENERKSTVVAFFECKNENELIDSTLVVIEEVPFKQ